MATKIESLDFEVGEDIFLVYSPEEDPGNNFQYWKYSKNNWRKNRKMSRSRQIIFKCYWKNGEGGSTKVAEMTKLLENIYRSVNIGLVNEIEDTRRQNGHRYLWVIDNKDKAIGYTFILSRIRRSLYPHRSFYLTWKAREYGIHTRFIELTGEILPKCLNM